MLRVQQEYLMKSENNSFWRTLATWVIMVVVSGLVWLGIRHFQTDVTPVAKPVPKVETAHE